VALCPETGGALHGRNMSTGQSQAFCRSAFSRAKPVFVAIFIDESDHGFHRRSSSARAKYADAFFNISLA
jgi:hypothetical protein